MTQPYYSDHSVTLYLGDALELLHWLAADVLITDPPYGSQGLAGGSYGRSGRTIAQDTTTATRDEALALWGDRPCLCFGTPRMPEPPGPWVDRLVWDKREPGMNGGPWRYTHEAIYVRGAGWVRTSDYAFSVIRSPSANGSAAKVAHVHAKPIGLMTQLVAASPPGVIADPFAGSGTTLVAAKLLGRLAIGVEIEERYAEITAQRLLQESLPL